MRNFSIYWNNKKEGVEITRVIINDIEIELNTLQPETLEFLSALAVVPDEREDRPGYNPSSMYSYKYMSNYISYKTMVEALDELKKLGHKRASWITMLKLRKLAAQEA